MDVVLAKPEPTRDELVSMAADVRQAVDHAERLIEALLVLARNDQARALTDPLRAATFVALSNNSFRFGPPAGQRLVLRMPALRMPVIETAHSAASTMEQTRTARKSPTCSDAMPTAITGMVRPTYANTK